MTPAEKKLAIHFFNTCGLSAFSEAYYIAQVAELKAENARLTGLLNTAKNRLGGDLSALTN